MRDESPTGSNSRSRRADLAFLSAVLLLDFALRVYRLGDQSLWYDEAFSVDVAQRSLEAIGRVFTTFELNPPLHTFLLHFWIGLAGSSEFAVRYLSLAAGLLAMPLIYALGRMLIGKPGAAVAALLVAFSPVHIAYSQETRGYSLVIALCLLSALGLLWALLDGRDHGWLVFAGAGLLALYTHYYAIFTTAAAVIFALLWLTCVRAARLRRTGPSGCPAQEKARPDRPVGRSLYYLFLAVAAIALGYLPWLGISLAQSASIVTYYAGSIDFPVAARETLETFATGRFGNAATVVPLTASLSLLAVAGLLSLAAGRQESDDRSGGRPRSPAPRQSAAFLITFLLLPLILAALFLVITQKPKFNARYALVVWPAFVLLVAAGALSPLRVGRRLGRAAASVLLIATISALIPFLNSYYHDPAYARDDWRGAAAFIRAAGRPGDAVVLVSGYAAPALRYYYGSGDWLAVPDTPGQQMDEVVDYPEVNRLVQLLSGKRRVWLVLWQDEVGDPNKLVAGVLSRAAGTDPPVQHFGSISVRGYDLPPEGLPEIEQTPQHPLDVNFGDRVRLLGYSPATPTAAPGDEAQLSLHWQALRALDDDFAVVVSLKDADGYEWGRANKRPASYLYYTMRWKPGGLVVGDVRVPVLIGTPPGRYAIHVGVFSATTMRSLDVLRDGIPIGTDVSIGELAVISPAQPPQLADLGLSVPPEEPVAGIRFLGAMLHRHEIPAGGQLDLTTFWEATAAPRPDLSLEVAILDAAGVAIARSAQRPVGDGYPSDRWQAGERLRGQRRLSVPAQDSGAIRLIGRLLDTKSGTPIGSTLDLGEARILGRQHNTTQPPAPRVRQRARLGNEVALLGYDIDRNAVRPGDTIHLRLYWQALATPARSYKVFTHLLDSDNRIAAQEDGIPGRGTLPTTSWIEGEYVTDEYLLKVKPEARPGEHLLEVGMYFEATGDRLSVSSEDGDAQSDHLILSDRVQVLAAR